MADQERPQWADYAKDLIDRMSKHGAMPTTIVVGILGYAVENENVGVDEHERGRAKSWLDRLVDAEGEPLDDKGRDAMQWASEENALAHNGTLSYVMPEEDRVTMSITVARRVTSLERAEARAKLAPHVESYLDLLLDKLYEPQEVPA